MIEQTRIAVALTREQEESYQERVKQIILIKIGENLCDKCRKKIQEFELNAE